MAGASRIVLAVPVAPAEAIDALRGDCDEIICLAQPTPFYAVGAHYANFEQTSDDEVVRLLDGARAI
jgi:putative phosphoribosyl transferase